MLISAVKIPKLELCTHGYAGIDQPCSGPRNIECLGESYCVHPQTSSTQSSHEGRCHPKQVFIGKSCEHHYECYKTIESGHNFAIFCDVDDKKCKFTREVGESCTRNDQCQSQYCKEESRTCQLKVAGHRCDDDADCHPFNGQFSHCNTNEHKCVAKLGLDQSCNGMMDKCQDGLKCTQVNLSDRKCQPYKKWKETCLSSSDCDPRGDGQDKLTCVNGVCHYPRYLREKFDSAHTCLIGHGLYQNWEYGICTNERCFKHNDCRASEICDCTNLVCQNKKTGNKVHKCYYVDGFNQPKMSAFEKCLNKHCSTSTFVDSIVMLNKKSCAYKNCRAAYRETADCVKKASETYLAENVYFF